MNKFKIAINTPRVALWNRKARKHGKKYTKFPDTEKYSAEWRNDFILKRTKKMLKVIDVDLEVIGYENLPKAPAILAPNHTSSFDGAYILCALEDKEPGSDSAPKIPVFLAKDDVLKNKRSRGYAQLLDTYYIDRKKPREALVEMDNMSEFSKKNKRYQVIFPEGTRSEDGKLGEFKGGAFRSAKKGFMPIVPVTINNALATTNKDRQGRLKVQVIFHPALKPMSLMSQENKDIAKNVQKIVQSKLTKPEGTRSKIEDKS